MVLVKGDLNSTPFGRIMITENEIMESENYISLYYLKGVTRQAGVLADGETKAVALRTAKYLSEALETPLKDMREQVAISEIRFEAVEKLIKAIKTEINMTIACTGGGSLSIEQSLDIIRNLSKIRKDKFINLDLTTHTDQLGEKDTPIFLSDTNIKLFST